MKISPNQTSRQLPKRRIYLASKNIKNIFPGLSKILDASCTLAKNTSSELIQMAKDATSASLAPQALIRYSDGHDIAVAASECICHFCWEELDISLPLLGFCNLAGSEQKTLPVASAVKYRGRARELIKLFKFSGDTILGQDLANLMSNGWQALAEYMPASKVTLVPVPLHPKRKRTRGYNQSELLARKLALILSLPVASNGLIRTRSTKSQQLLKRTERLKNVRGAFKGKETELRNRNIVLIDDVCTSGSTLVACADEALRCGALSVVALTVARAIMSAQKDSHI
jgi:ComF family protein